MCAQAPAELICLNCDSDLKPPGNWGTKEAMHKHGRIIRDQAVAAEAMAIVRLRGEGKIDQGEQVRLFADLSRLSGYKFG
jgi:hypothetical protein